MKTLAIAALAVIGCGPPRHLSDVPATFARIEAPVAEVVAPPDAAKVIVVGGNGSWSTRQAATIVLADGTALGQVMPYTWAAFDVPAGRHTIATGMPEIGAGCNTVEVSLEAGKVYTMHISLRTGNAWTTSDLQLSRLSRLEIDRAAGQTRVASQWKSYWASCIATAQRAAATPPRSDTELMVEALTEKQLGRRGTGPARDRITIPEPP